VRGAGSGGLRRRWRRDEGHAGASRAWASRCKGQTSTGRGLRVQLLQLLVVVSRGLVLLPCLPLLLVRLRRKQLWLRHR
jgi:hypothetical protein